jgi:hypothetical protein
MDRISNAPFTDVRAPLPHILRVLTAKQQEFDRWTLTCKKDRQRLPSVVQLERKYASMRRLVDQPVTEVRHPSSSFLAMS